MSAPFRFPKFFVTNPSPCPYLAGQGRAEGVHRAQRPPCERTQRGARPHRLPPQPVGRLSPELHRLLGLRLGPGPRRRVRGRARPSASCCAAMPTSRSAPASRGRPRSNMQLLRRYLAARHPGGGMAEMDESDFADMVEQTPVRTYVIEYREPSVDGRPGKLVGACLSDQQSDGLSMIYSFFDVGPDARQGPRHLHHPRPYHPRRARRPALRLSRLLGRRLDAHGLQDRLPAARAARPRRLAADGRAAGRLAAGGAGRAAGTASIHSAKGRGITNAFPPLPT